MAHGQCIYRRESGIYAARIVVPRHLRLRVGRGEIHISAGTSLRTMALNRVFRARARWLQHFKELDDLDANSLRLAGPHLSGRGVIALIRAAELVGLQPLDLARQITAGAGNLWSRALDWPVRRVPDMTHVNREDDRHLWQDVDAWGVEQRVTGLLSLMDSDEIVGQLERGARAEPYWVNNVPLDVRPGEEVFVEPGAVVVTLEDLVVQVHDVDRVRLEHLVAAEATERALHAAAHISTGSKPGSSMKGYAPAGTTPPPASPLPALGSGERITDLITAYVKARGTAPMAGFKAHWKPE
jgi:hypothetical protein